MSDLFLKPTEFGGEVEYDSRNDFVLTDGLFTACYISLFSEPYWGNSILPTENRFVSQLSQLFEKPISSSTRNIAIRTTERALNWLIENEIASESQTSLERFKKLKTMRQLLAQSETANPEFEERAKRNAKKLAIQEFFAHMKETSFDFRAQVEAIMQNQYE